MNLRLRIINNEKVPELPSLTGDADDNLTTDVKLDVLTHQEVDINFTNLIKYIKTISDKIISQGEVIGELTPEKIAELNAAAEKVKEVNVELEKFRELLNSIKESLDSFKTQTTESLNRKLETIKNINGVDIKGVGNAEVNITRRQFTGHLTNIGPNEVGSIAILECKMGLIFNNLYSGQNLFNETYAYMQGTWRCRGILGDKKGLFIRTA